jgi:hypothetical protein
LLCAGIFVVAYVGFPVGWILSRSLARSDLLRFDNLKLKLIPFIGFSADNISLFDPADAKVEIASVRRAFLDLSFTELLSGEPRLRAVTLSGVSLFVDRLARISPSGFPTDGLPAIDRMRIEDASITLADAPEGQGERLVLHQIDAELTFKPDVPYSLNAHATSGSYQIIISATAHKATADAVSFFPVSVSVDVAEKDSSLMLVSLLFTQDAATNLITGQTTSAAAQGQPFDARVTIDTSGKKIAAAVSADFGSLTLPTSLFSSAAATVPYAGSTKIFGALNKDMPDITVSVSAKEVKAPPINLSPAFAEGTLSNGELNVQVSRTIANGGNLSGELTIKSSGAAYSSFRVVGASLPLTRGEETAPSSISGTLDAEGSLEDATNHFNAAAFLSGELTFNIRNGAVNTPPLLRNVDALYAGLQSQGILHAKGELPFSLLNGKVKIDHGMVTSDNLLFQSPEIRASGHAEVDLKKQAIDLSFAPELPNGDRSSGQWKKLPVAVEIKGSFDDPQFSINANGTIINSKMHSDLQSKIADLLGLKEDDRAAIRDAIKGLFEEDNIEREK